MQRQKLNVNAVAVGDRYRDNLGDLTALMRSMAHEGQLQPIGVLDTGELLFGERRLEAARALGWDTIDVIRLNTVVEAVKALQEDQRGGQVAQLPMKPSERVAMCEPLYGLRRRELERGEFTYRRAQRGQGNLEVDTLAMGALGMGAHAYRSLRFVLNIYRGKRLRGNTKPVTSPERALAAQALAVIDGGAGVEATVARLRLQLGYLPGKQTSTLPFDPKRVTVPGSKVAPRPALMPQIERAAGRLFTNAALLRKRVADDRWPEQRSKLPVGVHAGLRELHQWLGEVLAEIPSPEEKEAPK